MVSVFYEGVAYKYGRRNKGVKVVSFYLALTTWVCHEISNVDRLFWVELLLLFYFLWGKGQKKQRSRGELGDCLSLRHFF